MPAWQAGVHEARQAKVLWKGIEHPHLFVSMARAFLLLGNEQRAAQYVAIASPLNHTYAIVAKYTIYDAL